MRLTLMFSDNLCVTHNLNKQRRKLEVTCK